MAHNPGGGHKINMLKPVIAEYKEKKDLLIMFTDRSRRILNFNVLDDNIVFVAMMLYWQPHHRLSSKSFWTLKQVQFSLLRASVGQTNH